MHSAEKKRNEEVWMKEKSEQIYVTLQGEI